MNGKIFDAAQVGDIEIILDYIEKGGDVNIRDNWDFPLLHYAVTNRHFDLTELLLTHGADIHAKDSDGWTALMYAAYRYTEDMIKLLLAHGASLDDIKRLLDDGWLSYTLSDARRHYSSDAEFLLSLEK